MLTEILKCVIFVLGEFVVLISILNSINSSFTLHITSSPVHLRLLMIQWLKYYTNLETLRWTLRLEIHKKKMHKNLLKRVQLFVHTLRFKTIQWHDREISTLPLPPFLVCVNKCSDGSTYIDGWLQTWLIWDVINSEDGWMVRKCFSLMAATRSAQADSITSRPTRSSTSGIRDEW